MQTATYEPGVFWRLDETTILRLLRDEGWAPVPIDDPAGHVYPLHRHPEAKLIAVIHGGMEVRIGHETYRCLAGDKLVIPGDTEHAAVVGPDGCTFFWSERRHPCRSMDPAHRRPNPGSR